MGEALSRQRENQEMAALHAILSHVGRVPGRQSAVNLEPMVSREFDRLRNPAHGMRDATSAKNAPRNRYSNVMPFDHNRVELSHPQDYINASHITVSSGAVQWAYIATQGPLERTCGDFWRMVTEYKSAAIVMLTPPSEGPTAKCWQYFAPEEGGSVTFSSGGEDFTVLTRQVLPEERGVQERILCVKSNKRGPMEVTHFYMRAWADFGVPADTLGVRYICQRLRGPEGVSLAGVGAPPVIHCSAGIGRTGTLISVDSILRRIDLLPDAPASKQVAEAISVPSVVNLLREQRVGMVQGSDQYAYIYQAVIEELQERAGA